MDDSLQILIKKSLELYDIQNEENKIFIKDKNILIKYESVNRNNTNFNEIEFNTKNQTFNYEVLGVFYLDTNIWIWSWCLHFLPKILSNESRKLFNYSFKDIDKDIDKITDKNFITYIKSQFTNSKILFKDKFELDIFLSICSYLLQNRVKFIYPQVKEHNKIIKYYLIK